MQVFAPTAFRYPAVTGTDYPYGLQDIASDSLARALLDAGLVVANDPSDQTDTNKRPLQPFSALEAANLKGVVSGAGLRAVATRGHCSYQKYAGFISSRGRTTHKMMARGMTALQLLFGNWITSEAAGSASFQITASIEYPAGVFNQATFSGLVTGTCAAGANILSDPINVSIPLGATFWVRNWQSGTDMIGMPATLAPYNSTAGDKSNFSNSITVVDNTMTDSFSGAAWGTADPVHYPLAILGITNQPAVLLLGDSLTSGKLDAADPSLTDGATGRSIGKRFGYMNAGRSGEFVSGGGFLGNHAYRAALAAYASHVVVLYGTNDLDGATSAATVLAALQTVVGYFPNQKVYICTVPPRTTSTDSWATVANQTAYTTNSWDSKRLTMNAAIKDGTGVPGQAGYFPLADAASDSLLSSKIKAGADGTAYSSDGIHFTPAGYRMLAESGLIDPDDLM